jgi:hypothetical protein
VRRHKPARCYGKESDAMKDTRVRPLVRPSNPTLGTPKGASTYPCRRSPRGARASRWVEGGGGEVEVDSRGPPPRLISKQLPSTPA